MVERDNRKKIKFVLNTPNVLTLIRLIAIVPLVILIAYWPYYRNEAFVLFLLIWLTDMLDGYIARHYNMITDFGKLFDPAVDKLFQVAVAVTMAVVGQLPLWVPVFIGVRELIMVIAAGYLLRRKNIVVYSDFFGKAATFFYVVALTVLFFLPKTPTWPRHSVFILPTVLSIVATLNYARKNLILPHKNIDTDTDTDNKDE